MKSFSCSVCTDPEDQGNKLFVCKNCGVYIHALCYGIDIEVEPLDHWVCSPCRSGIVEPTCVLCLQKTGAMKITSNNDWVHVICALFTEGVFFEDENDMEPVNLSAVSQSKQNKTCDYCLKAVGFCSLCSKSKCEKRIHVTCAQRNKCTIEITKEKDNSIDFRAYCANHKPSKSKRRVSSKFVRSVVVKKGQKAFKKKYSRSANQNADWILKNQTKEDSLVCEKFVAGSSNGAICDELQSHSSDKENTSCNEKIAQKEKKLAVKNQSNAKSSELVDIPKQGNSNAASRILKSIENKTIRAQSQTIGSEVAAVHTSTMKTKLILSSKEKKQAEFIEGMFYD